MATYNGYTTDQLRNFVNQYFSNPNSADIQFLRNQGLIPNTNPDTLLYYGLTNILGFTPSQAQAAVSDVFAASPSPEPGTAAKEAGITLPSNWFSLTPQQQVDWYASQPLDTTNLYKFFNTPITELGLSSGITSDEQGIIDLVTGAKSSLANRTFGGTLYDTAELANQAKAADIAARTFGGALYPSVEAANTAKAADLAARTYGGKVYDTVTLANAARTAPPPTSNTNTNTNTNTGLNALMQERANAMGLPPNVSSAGLSELAKYDFSKAAPQLRMAGTYLNPLLMPTNKTMTPGVAPTYTPTSAPTREEAFMQYAFPQGVQGVTNIEDNITRGLQFARNYNMNPTETLSFINRALPSGSYITPEGLKAAIEPRAGLLALAQPFTGPSVSFQRHS
ncbi:hypothetical protein EB118_13500 [bacterium]|nr:hypothetical protein [bacterium]